MAFSGLSINDAKGLQACIEGMGTDRLKLCSSLTLGGLVTGID